MYSSRQMQCMQAIGLVPWVRRTAAASQVVETAVAAVVPEAVNVASDYAIGPIDSIAPIAPIEVIVTESSAVQTVICTGERDSALLLIFDVNDYQANWPLSKADDTLLDGMLRAIGLSKASVCSGVVVQDSELQSELQSEPLPALCQAPRKRFLYFGGETIAKTSVAPVPMNLSDCAISGWRLPSLEILRAEPGRKRQAWITLKQLRSALDQH